MTPVPQLFTPLDRVPNHLAIIMDGNGRWAKERGHSRIYGHQKGVETLKNIIEAAKEFGIPYLTVWAFSTENWGRPPEEVNFLLALLRKTLTKDINELHEKNIKLNVIGLRDRLGSELTKLIDHAMELTQGNTGLTLTVAFNYGGRADLTHAVKQIALKVQAGDLAPDGVTEATIHSHLLTGGLPDPDLVVRPGNVQRLSNFMMWQCSYTEIYFSPVFWPDYCKSDLYQALQYYQKVERRFGHIKE